MTDRFNQLIQELDYELPESPVSIVDHRELLEVSNAGNAILSPNQSTSFVISASDRVLDAQKTWFSLEMKTDHLGATPSSITDILKSCEVLFNGQRIELIDDLSALEVVYRRVLFSNSYRKYDNQTALVFDDDRLNTDGGGADLDGANQLTDTQKGKKVRAMAGGYVSFAFRLNSLGVLSSNKYIPLLYTNGVELRFQLHNEKQGMSSLVNTPTNSNFSIKNFKMHYETISLTKQASSALAEAHRAGQLQLHLHSWNHSLKTSTGSFSHEIPSNKNICSELIHCQRATANLSDEKEDSHQYMGYNARNFQSGQLIYSDNQRIPNRPIRGATEAYMFLKNAAPNAGNPHVDNVSYYDFSGDGDLVANVDKQKSGFMVWPLETLSSYDLNGVSTKNGRSLVIDYSSTSTTPAQNDFFLGFEMIVNLESDGSVSVEE